VTYLDEQDQDEMTTVWIWVRVRRTRPGDDSPSERHPILARALKQWGSWRYARWAGTWGLPGEVAVPWHRTHLDSDDEGSTVRLGTEAMEKVPQEFRDSGAGMYVVDVWNGHWLNPFTPRRGWW
jgi:hypothetical protein